MGATWDDYEAALEMRDIIRKMVVAEVDKIRPRYEMAEVVSIERGFRYCMVRFPGDTEPIKVSMGSIQPQSIGQLVRVEGLIGDRFIADVIGPTYSSANARLDAIEDQLQNGPNLILNPGFESDLANWTAFWGALPANIETNPAHVTSGLKSVRFDFTVASQDGVLLGSGVPCTPGVPVNISYKVKKYGSPTVRDRLQVISAPTQAGATFFGSGSTTSEPIPWYTVGTGFELKQATFIPPAGHYFFAVTNRADSTSDGPASIWYDEFKAFSATGPSIGALEDVTLTSPVNGSILVYNGTDWVNNSSWQPWTPTISAVTTNPTMGNSTLVGRYCQVGKTVHVQIYLLVGSTFTAGSGAYMITNLPVAPRTDYWQMLPVAANLTTPAAGDFTGYAKIEGSSQIQRIHIYPGGTANGMTPLGGTGSTATLANGNRLIISGTYEAT